MTLKIDLSNHGLTKEFSIAKFKLHAEYETSNEQEKAIEKLKVQLKNSQERCILLGVTGSGKTFAMANLIEKVQRPTLIISHNKTLARQLYLEMASLFPENAVEYFVSHYDYYQPEAYLPKRDLYIDKELSINERVEQERFSAVASLVTRPDCIVVSSVSCIYGLNPPETFLQHHCQIQIGDERDPQSLVKELVALQYRRVNTEIARGEIRLRGENLDIWMPSRDDPIRIQFGLDGIERIRVCDPVTWDVLDELDEAWIHPKEFFMTSPERHEAALEAIEVELEGRIAHFRSKGMDLEAHRLEQKTQYDLEMLREIGHCTSVENYSMHFDGRDFGERPYCLLDFFASSAEQFHGNSDQFLVIMDESHVTLPQVGGMYRGDRSRKENLIEHGFRLPSAAENRPLKIHEFQELIPQMIYVSATPGERELKHLCEITKQSIPNGLQHITGGGGVSTPTVSKKREDAESMYDMLQMIDGIVRMELRPTGLLDPKIEVRPTEGQVADLLSEINKRIEKDERVLVTVLTIRFAEEVSEYLNGMGVKAHYLHSGIDTIERTEIINALRLGIIDVIVGINLLREGLDIPEVSLVAIFDADKEGFLRNERSLLQTIGRAARNAEGQVLLYSDNVSNAMTAAIKQTLERRERQHAHNLKHSITPTTIKKAKPVLGEENEFSIAQTGGKRLTSKKSSKSNPSSNESILQRIQADQKSGLKVEQPIEILNFSIEELKSEMNIAAAELDFERAAMIRDLMYELEEEQREIDEPL